MDGDTARRIYRWMDKNIEGCDDPRAHGKGLTANLSGKWRYRVGDWRVLAIINDGIVTVEVVKVAHRSEVYRHKRR
ncbi:MAG: type II toxin-antitoxin system RelE/ParE family toxin [Bifidobacterium sp.]|nr:type II toxin-antitoxin system RelE/ParE family toxin [Bifidobacterium sp.]